MRSVLLVLLFLVGCGTDVRLSKEQAQALAAARDGVQEQRRLAAQAQAPELTPEQCAEIDAGIARLSQAVASFIVAVAANAELPPSTAPHPRADLDGYCAAAATSESAPPPAADSTWATIVAVLGGSALAAAAGLRAIAPHVPGLGPVWRLAIDGAWNLLQHKKAKAADEAAQAARAVILAAAPALRAMRDADNSVAWNSLPAPARAAAIAIIDAAEKGA